MHLTYAQKQQIFEKGYVKVPGVIPQVMVNEALKAINHSLGDKGIDPEKLPTFRSQSYAPEVQKSPAILDLVTKTPAWSLAESAIGEGKVQLSRGGGQIALRFPQMTDPPPAPMPHLDGMHTPTNGVPKGQILNFTMLLGVMLNDVSQPYSGNLTLWPGSHYLYERYFREYGWESLLGGMPPVDLPEPIQIIGNAGDIVLCHYQLGHTAAINVSPNIRYAIYFRLNHIDHEQVKRDALTNIWLEWEGMRDFAPAEPIKVAGKSTKSAKKRKQA
jgi:phytanoyl-CoA dioxygenase PhyH